MYRQQIIDRVNDIIGEKAGFAPDYIEPEDSFDYLGVDSMKFIEALVEIEDEFVINIPGTELLNDDNPVLRLMPDGTVSVFGSPWSGKTPCYKAQDAPVGAIVSLCQAPQNHIKKLTVIQAYATLMESSSSFRPVKECADGWHRTLEGICAAVPFYRLECRPDRDAALICYNTVNG